LVHFRLAECFSRLKDRVSAANEFREALNGDLQPSWIKVWSHVNSVPIDGYASSRYIFVALP
jgi:hypothetical protein